MFDMILLQRECIAEVCVRLFSLMATLLNFQDGSSMNTFLMLLFSYKKEVQDDV